MKLQLADEGELSYALEAHVTLCAQSDSALFEVPEDLSVTLYGKQVSMRQKIHLHLLTLHEGGQIGRHKVQSWSQPSSFEDLQPWRDPQLAEVNVLSFIQGKYRCL